MSADASSQPAAGSDHAPVDAGPNGDDVSRRRVGRRTFIKGVTVGAVGVGSGAVGINYGSQEAEAIAPLAPFAVAAFAGAAGVTLLGDHMDMGLLGGDDQSGYTGADALRTSIAEDFIELKTVDERVMTSIENNIANSQTVALAKGKAAVVEAMNAEKSESEATTAMQDAIDSYFATIEENILTHYQQQIDQIAHYFNQLDAHENAAPGDVLNNAHVSQSDWHPVQELNNRDIETIDLLDGSTFDLETIEFRHESTGHNWLRFELEPFTYFSTDDAYQYATEGGEPIFAVEHPTDGMITYDPLWRFKSAFDSVSTERDAVNNTLSGFVTDVYNAYEPGEIPTEDLVDPITAATELSQDYDGYQAQGAHAAMLGIPTTAEQSVHITVHRDDGNVDLWTDLYTEHVPLDDSGNEVGFEAEMTYSPSEWTEPLYIAYEYTGDETDDSTGDTNTTDTNTTETETSSGTSTQTDFVQLEQEFTINTIENKDGETVDSFQTEERVNQTADVSNLKEELDQIRQTQIEMQEEAQSGGGGLLSGFSIGGIPGVGVVALIGAAALALLGND